MLGGGRGNNVARLTERRGPAAALRSMRYGTGGPAICAGLRGCSGTCSMGRKGSREGCHRRWPK
jgi:hypothetical protein